MSECYYIEKGSIVIIPDPLHPNFYQIKRNPAFMEIPVVYSFSDFLIWNYAEDYERAIRNALSAGKLPFGEHIRNYRKPPRT